MIYLVQYRAGGRTRRFKLGAHGVLTAEEARDKAREVLGAVAKGENPAQDISAQRKAPTVAQVCDRFIREHVRERLKPTTQREYTRNIERFIKPALGTLRVIDVTRADIAALHYKTRSIPYQANRNLQVLSKLFNMCELWGLRPDGSNPCRHVPKYKERQRERFLSKDELARLGTVLDARLAQGLETPFVVAAFKLLVFTGCRLREIQTLKWEYVQDPHICLPDSKTGARRVPLPPAALSLLRGLSRASENPFMIQGDVTDQHVTDLQKPWRRIRAEAGLDDVRIHDLRHTYASHAVMDGQPLPIVARLLGHTALQTTMRYAHLSYQPVREAAEVVSGSLADALSSPQYPGPLGPNVRIFPNSPAVTPR
jgi:integrase